jgi:hypothetical protein
MAMRDLLTYDPENFSKPRYIQRLGPPSERDNPFAFGASGANGGMGTDAMDRLRPVWSFEYMGAAEYESGASGAALARIAEGLLEGTYESWNFFPRLRMNKKFELAVPPIPIPLWVIGRSLHRSEIEASIEEFANKPQIEYEQLKEGAHIASSLRPSPDTMARQTKGWLELMNGYLFFRDDTMFERALRALDISDKA